MDVATYRRLYDIAMQLPPEPGIGKVEIAHGTIVMMMSPVNRHELNVMRLRDQLAEQMPMTHPGYVAWGGAYLEDIHLGRLRIPDLMVFPEESLETQETISPHDVILTVEVVSKSNPENDYVEKVADYARMGIPHYLIVDPRDGTGIHYSGIAYRDETPFRFGDTVKVGNWTLDSSVLRLYEDPK